MTRRNTIVLQSVILVGLLVLTAGYHYRYADAPLRMSELRRVHAAIPYAEDENIAGVLQAAARQHFSYLDQLLITGVVSANTVDSVSDVRIWHGLFAALAVLWTCRLGCLLCNRYVGFIGAAVMAFAPPAFIGMYALHMWIVLVHAELFFYAVRTHLLGVWGVWSLVSIALFLTGVFAEPLLLQTWFAALALVWVVWFVLQRYVPESLSPHYVSPKRKDNSDYWRNIRKDPALFRCMIMCSGLFVFTFIMSLFIGVATGYITASFRTLIVMLPVCLILATGLTALCLILPSFRDERLKILDAISRVHTFVRFATPDSTFIPISSQSFFHMLCAYAVGIMLFLPLFYIFYRDVSLFVRMWEVPRFFAFLAEQGVSAWILFLLPWIGCGLTVFGYFTQVFTRARLIGAVALLICSSLYIVQHRYAVFSAPFFILATTMCFVVPCEIVAALVSSLRLSLAQNVDHENR